MLSYLIQMFICSALLYGYYHFFLKNEKFHQHNRFYLISIMLLSIILPLFKIQVYFNADDAETIYQSLGSLNESIVIVSTKAASKWLNATNAIYLFYTIITIFFIIQIIVALLKIIRIKQSSSASQLDDIIFINTKSPEAPFSFLKWLFWNDNIELDSKNGAKIFRHEMYHIQKKHTYDLLFTEIVTAIFWFNPFFHLIKKEIKIIQEFLADKHATQGNDESEYAELLLMQAIGSYKNNLVNPFFHNQLKRRIAMLTTSKKPAHQWLRKLMVLPIAAITIALFAFSYKKEIKEVAPAIEEIVTNSTNNNFAKIEKEPKLIKEDEPTEPADTVPKKSKKQEPEIFTQTEVPASYPGNWVDYLTRNLKAQVAKDNGAPAGRHTVKIEFVVDLNGNVTDIKALTNVGYGMEDEAIRVIKKSGKWKTAIQNGKRVKAYRQQPITFEVTDKKKETTFTPPVVVKDEKSNKGNGATVIASEPEIFTKVEVNPVYPGNWIIFLTRNLNPQVIVDNGAPIGAYTVKTRFIVDVNGNVSDINPLTNIGYGMEDEAIRVIEKSGKWKPAIQNGHSVKAYREQPITFEVTKG